MAWSWGRSQQVLIFGREGGGLVVHNERPFSQRVCFQSLLVMQKDGPPCGCSVGEGIDNKPLDGSYAGTKHENVTW